MTSRVSWDPGKVKVDTAKETSQRDRKRLCLTILLYVLERQETGREREREKERKKSFSKHVMLNETFLFSLTSH